MPNVLSQDEVDSLLDGISKGNVETESDVSDKGEGLDVFDFSREAGPMHLKMPALGIINERFVGFLKTSLSVATGSVIDVNIDSIESVKFGKFCRSIPIPTSLNIFKMEPLRGFALLVLEGSLVYAFVDTLFGGKSGNNVKLEGKSFTPIEVKIIDKIVKTVISDLQHAWSDVHEVKMVFTRSEIDPQFAGISTPDDMIITVKFMIDFGNFSGVMTLCIPYSTIEPIRDKLRDGFKSEKQETDELWGKYFEEKIRESTINMSCTLGRAKVTGRELLEIKVDDLIRLDQKMTDPVIISVEGIPKFTGFPGEYGKMKAVRVEARIDEE